MDFINKIAIVTGGASGMGAATARELAAAGAQVVIVDRNGALAAEVAQEIGAETAVGDISDPDFCQQVVDEVVERYGRLDILVNAAGIIVRADALGTSNAQWQQVMNVNVSGIFYLSRAAVAVMKQQGKGVIVNFGSIWGGVGAAGVVAYCASKGAVHQLTRAMALDHVKDGIRINAVCPGEVNTPMLASERSEPVTEEILQRIASTVPMERLADPVEIARVVLFLASDDASYMTGAMVNVDAGYTAR
ncbi:MAG: SDR family oxidoreductase [Ardenticatenaceae bacterium]|nr:SDR family oxidoreductase [Ardenticatenaceae bacterium]MCB8973044.1 SDR family oxidoreductase [Ardenticatenaceae bacterium]